MRRSVVSVSLLAACLVVVDCQQMADTGPAFAALAGLVLSRSGPPVAEARRLGGRVEALGAQLAGAVAEAAEADAAAERAQPGDDAEPASAGGAGDDLWGAATLPDEDSPDPGEPRAAEGAGAEGEGMATAGGERLVSVARETWVLAEPRWHGRRLGYLRAGAAVARSTEPVGRRGCRGGWYAVAPRGYVCAGRTASLDLDHPVAQLFAVPPRRDTLPYGYAIVRASSAPIYARLPTASEQRRIEPRLGRTRRVAAVRAQRPGHVPPPPPDAIPPALAGEQVLPGLGGRRHGADTVLLGRAAPRAGFALIGSYDHQGRRFGLTTDLGLIPLDCTRMVRPSALRGVRLSDEFTLPVAIVRSHFARRYLVHPSGGLALGGMLPWRAAIALSGRHLRRGGQRYLEARDGSYLRADKVIEITRFRKAPGWARGGGKWIDVSILRQALVAYQGTEPVYATIVSTGADGVADPEDSHATIQGTFRIHTKHLSVTMDGDEEGDAFDLREVPFVQYFTEGYALHAAYWHDDFGRPKSHGCVNLSPADAAWLFSWTTPTVPRGWHAALSLHQGTIVHLHP